MHFLELVKKRKTTYEYTSKEISDRNLKKILEAARWTPSSLNSQDLKFIVVKNPKTIEKLVATCYYGGFYTEPKVLVGLVLEPIYSKQKGMLRGKFKEYAAYHKYLNAGLPVWSMCLEAEELGINSCILSPPINKANKILRVPNDCETVLLIGFGYEKKNAFQKHRHRKPLNELVYNEFFRKTRR